MQTHIAVVCFLLFCTANATGLSESECSQGDKLRQENRIVEAIREYESCLKTSAASPVLHHNLGVLYLEINNLGRAQQRLESAIALAPLSAVSHSALGEVFLALGRCHQAAAAHRTAARAAAQLGIAAEAHRNVYLLTLLKCPTAIQSRELLAVSDAATALSDAIASGERVADWTMWLRVGTVALNGQRCSEAIVSFQIAIRLGAEGDDAMFGIAMCLALSKMHAEAAAMFSAAARRGTSRQTLARMAAAMNRARAGDWSAYEHRRQELLADIEQRYLAHTIRGYSHSRDLVPNRDLDEASITFDRIPRFSCVQPHEALILDLALPTFRLVASVYARSQAVAPLPPPRLHHETRAIGFTSKLTLGYLSSDFTAHATSHLLKGAFELHAASGVQTHCFSAEMGGDPAHRAMQRRELTSSARMPGGWAPSDSEAGPSDWRSTISQHCSMHTLPHDMSSEASAALVAAASVQVLINLNGWTAGHRNDVFELRAAPVQCSYLGYPGTMGAGYMDYFLSDRVATPPELAHAFTEKLAIVPGCYYVNDHARYHGPEAKEQQASGRPGSSGRNVAVKRGRDRAGIPEKCGVVAANLNQIYKATPAAFDAWLEVLRTEPASCLWQIAHKLPAYQDAQPDQQQHAFQADAASSPEQAASGPLRRMERRAGDAGLEQGRVVWTDDTDILEFIRRCGLADVVLDTAPITAHTVAMDVLWMGTPLVTLPGQQFASRVAASILSALSSSAAALIARSPQDYKALARALIVGRKGRVNREKMRANLEGARWEGALFDTALSVRHVERAARLMWEVKSAGGVRHHVIVAQLPA